MMKIIEKPDGGFLICDSWMHIPTPEEMDTAREKLRGINARKDAMRMAQARYERLKRKDATQAAREWYERLKRKAV